MVIDFQYEVIWQMGLRWKSSSCVLPSMRYLDWRCRTKEVRRSDSKRSGLVRSESDGTIRIVSGGASTVAAWDWFRICTVLRRRNFDGRAPIRAILDILM